MTVEVIEEFMNKEFDDYKSSFLESPYYDPLDIYSKMTVLNNFFETIPHGTSCIAGIHRSNSRAQCIGLAKDDYGTPLVIDAQISYIYIGEDEIREKYLMIDEPLITKFFILNSIHKTNGTQLILDINGIPVDHMEMEN